MKEERSIPEKVLDFTGGKEIAQGLGQALTQRRNAKLLEDVQKGQMDTQSQILQRIKEKKTNGEDTSHLEKTLEELGLNISNTGSSAERNFLNPNELSNKEVLGDALQLATTAGGAKVAGAVAGNATKATGVIQGIAQGAKTGALGGAAVGGLTGVSQGLQDEQDAAGIAKSGLTGAAFGAAGGAALGGITGGVSGAIKGSKTVKDNFAKELVSPKQTAQVKEQAFKEGRVTDPGFLRKSKILASKRDEELADAVGEVVSPKKSVTENLDAIRDTVSDINDGVKTYVKQNKVPLTLIN